MVSAVTGLSQGPVLPPRSPVTWPLCWDFPASIFRLPVSGFNEISGYGVPKVEELASTLPSSRHYVTRLMRLAPFPLNRIFSYSRTALLRGPVRREGVPSSLPQSLPQPQRNRTEHSKQLDS